MFIKCLSVLLFYNTVTSHLFTHILSTEVVRKDMRDCKDTRGTKHTITAVFRYCF